MFPTDTHTKVNCGQVWINFLCNGLKRQVISDKRSRLTKKSEEICNSTWHTWIVSAAYSPENTRDIIMAGKLRKAQLVFKEHLRNSVHSTTSSSSAGNFSSFSRTLRKRGQEVAYQAGILQIRSPNSWLWTRICFVPCALWQKKQIVLEDST